MREVIYPKPEDKRVYSGEKCPSCGGKLYHSTIPCPNPPREGFSCCVIHYGYICEGCGKIYQ